MITCPRCGAENKDDAPVCRMCATPLDAAAAAPVRPAAPAVPDMPATVLIPSPGAPGLEAPGGRAPAGKAICPACGATNDADWAFCQQCGSRLAAAQAPAAPAQPWSAPTVVTPPPPLPPTAPPPAVPPPAPPPQAQWGAQTVISPQHDFSAPPVPQPPPPPPAAPAWGAPTVITPAPDLSQFAPPPQPPQPPPPPAPVAPPPQAAPPPPQQWGAETVVTPSPDFGQVVPPPAPAWGAATVVTPPQAPFQPQAADNIPTVLNPPPPEPSAYLDTIVDPEEPKAGPGGTTGFATDDVATAGVPVVHAEPSYVTTPTATPTAGIGQPVQPAAAAPPDQHTIVMSSTPVASPPKTGRLLLIMEGGDVGETFPLRPTETGIGRVDGDIKFPHDGYMSSRHARILQRNGRFFLIDNNSRNGTFVKIHQEVELHAGDVVLIGKQLFRFEADE